ncbi:M17 family metallopeptidase [Thermopetrobacter sp. TC1]|uniref:leucyl aminopeptidase family protein n=1 Tax=Thermopetrobacter sp. TC1 TaxID=1495045 RepID=UPI00068DC5BC|nr:leucyl aminopeptidase family protein [Thermopetrobacter sp. TC1]
MQVTPENLLLEAGACEEAQVRPLYLVKKDGLAEVLPELPEPARTFAENRGFSGKTGDILLLPDAEGRIIGALGGIGPARRPQLAHGAFARALPEGCWRLASTKALPCVNTAVLGWLLSAYQFDVYRKPAAQRPAQLLLPEGASRARILNLAEAVYFARNLINTPARDLGPAELEDHARTLAESADARIRVIKGAALKRGYPLIHAVGAGASPDRAPRLIEMFWGPNDAPRVAIIGKGVCFDTGGLDLKPPSAMQLMKKDMGGAAAALALARMIMRARLPLRLHVLIPAVENAVSGSAMRPSDVLRSRKGLSVEVGNTDAEGRLILADALARAAEEKPEIAFDFATLTGAARAALGPELPALFSTGEDIANALMAAGRALDDPLWHMPLWRPYLEDLKSTVADLCNISAHGHAGAITAALFLSRFAEGIPAWVHVDLFAWNPKDKPARPKGGELQAARAVFAYLEKFVKEKGQA